MSKKSGTPVDLDSFDLTEADLQLEEFDSAEYLNTQASIAAYLSFAAQSGNAEHFKAAIKTAARAQKMAKIAEHAGITREGTYKSLKPGTKTQLQTALSILDALGMAVQIVPKESLADDNNYAVAA